MPRKRPVIAPLPISASLSLRVETPEPLQPRKAKPRYAGLGRGICKVRCAGDNLCVACESISHELHICKHSDCICRTLLRESGKGVTP
jgi:hypothetical protein